MLVHKRKITYVGPFMPHWQLVGKLLGTSFIEYPDFEVSDFHNIWMSFLSLHFIVCILELYDSWNLRELGLSQASSKY